VTETGKTLSAVAVALVLAAAAWITSAPSIRSSAVSDRGQRFFGDFNDPNAATSLEVVEFDEHTSAARPFKVLNREGRWTIPSHDDYPADGASRLASIAAAVIALKKDDIAGDNVSDHERCGVLDPVDEALPTPRGRGTRITVRGRNDRLLADVIVGQPLEGRPNFRYVRVPGQNRIYVAGTDGLNISTRFEDWIERNLLQVERREIDQIVIRNYSAHPKTGRAIERETLVLRKKGEDVWAADGMNAGETMNAFAMNLLVTKLIDLTIADVRAKPASVTATLSQAPGGKLTRTDVADLAAKGFYFASDGRLLSNDGEVMVHTSSGIFYILRFGEMVADRSAPASRYLFISPGFDASAAGAAEEEVGKRLDVLRARFAPWYYIVSDDDVKRIRLTRHELVKSQASNHASASSPDLGTKAVASDLPAL
jgi:hypothetical protein